MLGTWKIIKQITNKRCLVVCELCGHETQKFNSKLYTLHRCPSIIDDTKYCYKCQTRKKLELFHKDASVSGGYSKVCKECYSERAGVINYKYKPVNRRIASRVDNSNIWSTKQNGIEHFLEQRQNTLKHRHKKKPMDEYNLPSGHLYELYKKQNGKCYYTNVPLKCTQKSLTPYSISVDKLTPKKGYTVGNVVLCIHSINSMKLDMDELEFKQFLSTVRPGLQNFVD